MGREQPPLSSEHGPQQSPSSSVVLPGQTDLSTVDSNRAPYYRSVARIGIQVARALDYAHREGVIHRDIKPSNLLLDTDSRVWITDFGLAKTDGAALTQTGDIVGTVRYMAPERFRGWSDPRSDVYSLGLTLYELLLLRPAFEAPDRLKLIDQVTHTEPPRLRKVDPGIPRDLETILHKAIDKEPARRYASAAELAADLERFVDDRPIRARRVGPLERAWRWSKRSPAVASLLAAVLLATLTGSVGVLSQWRAAVAAKDRAEGSEQEAVRQRDSAERLMHDALVREVRMIRLARRAGYRDQVRARIEQALALRIPDKYRDELRREFVACMGDFVGLEPLEVTDFPPDTEISSIAPHPQASVLAVGLNSGWVSLRQLDTGKEIARLAGEPPIPGPVQVAWDPQSGRLIVRHRDGTIKAWEQDRGNGWKVTKSFRTNVWTAITGFAASGGFPTAAFTTTPDGKRVVVSWDPVARFRTEGVRIVGYLSSPFGSGPFLSIASWMTEGAVSVWNVDDGTLAMTFDVPGVASAAVSPDGKLLATCAGLPLRPTIHVWDLATGKPVRTLDSQLDRAHALSFSPDGKYLACACHHGVAVYETSNFQRHAFVRGTVTHAVAFSPDNQHIAYLTHQVGTVRLWDISMNQEVAVLPHPGFRVGVAFGHNGQALVTAGLQSVRIWKLAIPAEKLVLSGHAKQVPAVTFDSEGKRLASMGRDGTAKIWDTTTGQNLSGFELAGWGETVAISPDNRLLALGGGFGSRKVPIVDLRSGKRFDVAVRCGVPWYVAFSSAGRHFGVGGWNGWEVWRIEDDARPDAPPRLSDQPVYTNYGSSVQNLCLSPDGRFLAWKQAGSTVHVRELDNPRSERRLGKTHAGDVIAAFFPDGKRLIFVNPRREAEQWDVTTGEKVASFDVTGEGEGTAVSMVIGLSRDGCRLAVSSLSGQGVNVFDTQTGKLRLALPEDRGMIWCLAWSPDGNRLAVSRDNGGVAIWDIANIAKQLAGLGLDQ